MSTVITNYHRRSGGGHLESGGMSDANEMETRLRARYGLVPDVPLAKVPLKMHQLNELLPPASFTFLLTLCEPALTKLEAGSVAVTGLLRLIDQSLAQALEDCKEKNLRDQPDVLFEPVVTALIAMLRHVVPMPAQAVDLARRRANLEFNASAQAAEQSAKQAAKQEKKAKKAQEAASRKERLAAKKGGSEKGSQQEGPSSPTSSSDRGGENGSEESNGVETGNGSPVES
ncbi:hypothetical protein AB1Y20_011278 [Prymnesium parvum]|uniref:Uncharacterized protein n=1 Tax=Prymnesium parvum TaxID=97485 RepID=A0AB34IP57_PRYPA